MTTVIRWLFTLALLVGVYSETGIWTTAALAGVAVYIECKQLIERRWTRLVRTRSLCGRCKQPTGAHEQACWYCNEPICLQCWDEYGHCGHPGAVAANERARQAPIRGRYSTSAHVYPADKRHD
jgi:hypothetical protein